MIQIFKSKPILAGTLYVIVGFVFFLFNQFLAKEELAYGFNLWGRLIVSPSIWINSLVLLFAFVNVFLINRLYNTHEFYDKKSYLSGFIYLLFILGTAIFKVPSIVVAHFFVIGSLMVLITISQHEDAKKSVFNASFLMSLAVVFNPTLLPMLFFPLFALLSSRVFNFREFFLHILGVLTPFIYLFSLLFFNQKLANELTQNIVPFNFSVNLSILIGGFVAIVAILIVFSFFIIQKKVMVSSIRFKQINKLIWLMLPFTLMSDLLTIAEGQNIIFISAIPLSVLFSTCGLILRKTFFYNLILVLLCIVIFCIRWMV